MELSIVNRLQVKWALATLLIVVSLVGCSSTGGSKWSFGRKDLEKSDQLATYRENRQAVQTDGDIIPPANKAKPEATAALGEQRLADSGYRGSNGPKYNETLDQLNQPPVNAAENYAAVEQMASKANAASNNSPVAYKEENASPMDPAAFPTNVPPIVSPQAPAIASNTDPSSTDSLALPPVPEMPGSEPVPAPISPAIASDSTQNNNAIAPVNYQTEIPESEAQAFTPSDGVFLPGSLDINRFETEFANPSSSSTQPNSSGTNQTYPTTPPTVPDANSTSNDYLLIPPDGPGPINPQTPPGMTNNQNVPHELKNSFNKDRVVIVKNSRAVMTESDFCSLGYHDVANLATGKPIVAKTSSRPARIQMSAENNVVPVVQTSLVRPLDESSQNIAPCNPESIADSTPPILMNLAPMN
ncbi:MAG: hypothetical protein IJQ39_04290 [Thermoguttaceae bacterium]|nr:hypothetical protein [Thermoguttaceae bacterium]